jgi:hypothetical protein
MSRAIAGVFIFSLAFPVLAMIALAASGAFNPDFLSTFLVGGIVTTFVVLALFEIRRLVEQDSQHANQSHAIIAAAPPQSEFRDAVQARDPVISEAIQGAEEIRVWEAPPTMIDGGEETSAEPILVEPAPRAEVVVTAVAEPEAASGVADKELLAVDSTESAAPQRAENGRSLARGKAASQSSRPQQVAPIVAKGKRKGGSKRPVK